MGSSELIEKTTAKIRTPLSYLVRIALITIIAYSVYFHLWRILFINILLLVIILIPTILKRYKIEIPAEIEFILLLFVILSFFLGELRGLIIQIFFGLAIGFVGFALMLILYKNSGIKPNYLLILLFAISFSLALGTVSEIVKFYLKLYFDYNLVVGDYKYAIVSLTLVLAGALIASITGYTYMKGHKMKLISKFVQRFKKKNPNLFVERTDSPEEVLELIKKGENERLEFKSTLRTNLHTGDFDKRIEQSVLKTITAFLNSGGGTLLIGVSDTGLIFGIERDHFQSNDKFNLHFTNLIKDHIGNEFLPYMNFELVLIEEKNILKVNCKKSEKPVFLKSHKLEEFYIRIGAATVQIFGSKLIDYIRNNFGG
ncbi:MAG: ATP-binding protein [Candidatus Portnoybacteria bacterium]|nr:ATP-binding protein [Candidatus Portnoybacteria bacterium]